MDITVQELKEKLNRQEPIHIIDVREELEYHSYNIGGSNIPLGKLAQTIDEIDYNKTDELIVVCQRGLRSKTAQHLLMANGFTQVRNLTGGILALHKAEQTRLNCINKYGTKKSKETKF